MGTNGRLEFTLDGLIFRRTTSAAATRGVERLHSIEWASIEAAAVERSGKGKPVVVVQVAGVAPVADRKRDPHALKVKRSQVEDARRFVDLVNNEVATRRGWDAAAEQGA